MSVDDSVADLAPLKGAKLHHLGLVVPELEPHASRIAALLGAQITEQGDEESLGEWCWLQSDDSIIVELIRPYPGSDGAIARFLESRGPGLHHVSLWADDLDHCLAWTGRCGFDVIGLNRDHGGYEEFFMPPKQFGGALWHLFREKGS